MFLDDLIIFSFLSFITIRAFLSAFISFKILTTVLVLISFNSSLSKTIISESCNLEVKTDLRASLLTFLGVV